ncbi:MFS general substrate transporter [Lactarius psammicola]|nr:MFS general substrate transporter [Lactarius psammicola]
MSVPTQEKVECEGVSTTSHFSSEGDVAEGRIWRKLDTHLLPLATLLYLLSFLDRTNIGFARIAGMAEDLHLVGLRYNIAAAMFFIPYCLVEVPSNVLLKIFRPSLWIPFIMIVWGTIMSLMSLVNSYQGLVIARVFLGLAEGGLFPGLTYYISLWYPRQMQAKRVGIFVSAAAVSGAFGGILAYGIRHLEGKAGLHGWQWIFLIEGLATVGFAFLSYFLIHDYPETATFLKEEERQFVVRTLVEDSKGQAAHFSTTFVWQALADWKTYVQAVNFLCFSITGYSIALFTPTIIRNLGFSAANAQLLSVPPFACASVSTFVISFYSDRVNLRGPFVVLCSVISMIGYLIAYTTSKPGPGYAAAVIAACGTFPGVPVLLVWAGGNAGGNMKRGVVLAVVIGLGNLGGICSSFIYYQPPRFHKGHGTVIGCLGMSIICSCIMMWTYKRLNKEKEEQCAREGINEDMKDMYRELADKSPLFRYVI